MKLITAIIRPQMLDEIREALATLGVLGMTLTEVKGHGRQRGHKEVFRGKEYTVDLIPKIQIEVAVGDALADQVISTIEHLSRTGDVGDGKIFVVPLEDCIRIRTGERGEEAL